MFETPLRNEIQNAAPLTAEKAANILAANGLRVSIEQATVINEFLTKLVQLNLKNENSRSLHKSKHR